MKSKHSPTTILLAVALAASATAAEYPERPIRFIVPVAPGGTPDIIARVVGAELNKQMGQSIVIDNRAGANGVIGMQLMAKAAPDGYTIGYASISALALNPGMHAKLPYDADKELQAVVQLVFGMHILTVSPLLPVKSVQELIDYAKQNPGKLSYGRASSRSPAHARSSYSFAAIAIGEKGADLLLAAAHA